MRSRDWTTFSSGKPACELRSTELTSRYYDRIYLDFDFDRIRKELGDSPSARELEHQFVPYAHEKLSSTRLIHAPNLSKEYNHTVYLKLEGDNETGSFKDRETRVAIAHAVSAGARDVSICSSGNAAISASYYATKAGLICHCFVPETTSEEKVNLIRKYCGIVHFYIGDYADGYRLLADSGSQYGFNITTGISSLRTEADKAIAYEIFEQLGRVPSYVHVPVGNGACFSGLWKGFYDLAQLNLADSVPYLNGVCHATSNPIGRALKMGVSDYRLDGPFETFYAEGLIGAEAYCSPKALLALCRGEGGLVETDDTEIRAMKEQLVRLEAIDTEPTSAAAAVGLRHGPFTAEDVSVVVLTGRLSNLRNS